jgi:K+-transporting ATPase ATPase C chain
MWNQLLPALRMTLALTLLTGLAYPALVTVLCQALFPAQANGSLIEREGRVVGSSLLAQPFQGEGFFHPRPMTVSNLGPTSKKLIDRVKTAASGLPAPIPADLLTASASGLDPHISPASALAQVPRVARARGLAPAQLAALVNQHTEPRDLGFLGEPRVNVLLLNLALQKMVPAPTVPISPAVPQ